MCFSCGTIDPFAEPDPCCASPDIKIAVFLVVGATEQGEMCINGVYAKAEEATSRCDDKSAVSVFPLGVDQTEQRTFRMWSAQNWWHWVTI